MPEAVTWGATRSEAETHSCRRIGQRTIGSHGRQPAQPEAVSSAWLAAGISNREFADRLGLDEKAVRRLRDPLQRSAIGAIEAALRCLGKCVEVTVLDRA